jgi:hypothetical protein
MVAQPGLRHSPWNEGKIVGRQAPFKLNIRIRLQLAERSCALALFNGPFTPVTIEARTSR